MYILLACHDEIAASRQYRRQSRFDLTTGSPATRVLQDVHTLDRLHTLYTPLSDRGYAEGSSHSTSAIWPRRGGSVSSHESIQHWATQRMDFLISVSPPLLWRRRPLNTRRGAPPGSWVRPLRSRYAGFNAFSRLAAEEILGV